MNWTKKHPQPRIKETYRVRLICNNCEQDHYIDIEKGKPSWVVLPFYSGTCSYCGCSSFRKALFQ